MFVALSIRKELKPLNKITNTCEPFLRGCLLSQIMFLQKSRAERTFCRYICRTIQLERRLCGPVRLRTDSFGRSMLNFEERPYVHCETCRVVRCQTIS